MTPLTTRQKQLIAKNVLAACKDITKLNKTGYNFLSQACGFIAHYDLQGFIAHYSYVEGSLQADIEANALNNQWRNFRQGDRDYEYQMAKREAYNMILGGFVAREMLDQQYSQAVDFLRSHVQFIHVA
jgi:hypothetical protein